MPRIILLPQFFQINKWQFSQSGGSWIQCYIYQCCALGGESFLLLSFLIALIDSIKKSLRFLEINVMQEVLDIWYLFQYNNPYYMPKIILPPKFFLINKWQLSQSSESWIQCNIYPGCALGGESFSLLSLLIALIDSIKISLWFLEINVMQEVLDIWYLFQYNNPYYMPKIILPPKFFQINKWQFSQSGESWIQCNVYPGCALGGESFSLLSFLIALIDSIKKSLRFLEINVMQEVLDIWYLFQYNNPYYMPKIILPPKFFLINKWQLSQSSESWIQCNIYPGCALGGESFSLLSLLIALIDSIKKSLWFLEINVMQEVLDIWYLFQYNNPYYMPKIILPPKFFQINKWQFS